MTVPFRLHCQLYLYGWYAAYDADVLCTRSQILLSVSVHEILIVSYICDNYSHRWSIGLNLQHSLSERKASNTALPER